MPVEGGALGIHEVELVVQTGEDLGDGSGVGYHVHGKLHQDRRRAPQWAAGS
jgi:hypothetical protein